MDNINFKDKENFGVAHIAILMIIFTLISKLLGFIRETVMADFFGAGYITDSYVMAQSIPNIMFGGLFIAVSTAYMPMYSKIRENKGSLEGDLFTSKVINILLVFSIITSILGFFFANEIVEFFAKNFDAQRIELTVFYIKITFLYTFFSATAGILDAYLQYGGKFITPIIAGYALNVMAIIVIILSGYTNYLYLAWGMFLGQMGRCIILIIKAKQAQFKYTVSFSKDETIKKIIVLAVPVFISSSIQQINSFVDKSLASGLQTGSVSALYFAMLIVTLITGLTSSIISTIIYPKIAKTNANKDISLMSQIINRGINLIIIVTIPFSLGSVMYSTQVVQIVFERGAFDQFATELTSSAFLYYGVGISCLAVNDLIIRIYYSLEDMRTPMLFATISVLANIIGSISLVKIMGHDGLALATSISFFINMVLLFLGMKNKYPQVKMISSKIKIIKIIVASVLAIYCSYFVYNLIISCLNTIIFMRAIQMLITILIAIIIYIMILYIFKIEEVYSVKNYLTNKNRVRKGE